MIEASNLNLIPDVRHGFFTREGGFSSGHYGGLNCSYSSGDEPENVARNRDHIATTLGLEGERLVVARQFHSAEVVTVKEPWTHDEAPKADGLVTAEANIALGVTTADCAPVLFADREAGVIGAAHAGWRGALGGVTDATIEAMLELGASRAEISAAVGPTISRRNYEVGPEFHQAFMEAHEDAARFFSSSGREGHYLFDLPAYLDWRLRAANIASVEVMDCCTYGDEARFSASGARRIAKRRFTVVSCRPLRLGPTAS